MKNKLFIQFYFSDLQIPFPYQYVQQNYVHQGTDAHVMLNQVQGSMHMQRQPPHQQLTHSLTGGVPPQIPTPQYIMQSMPRPKQVFIPK